MRRPREAHAALMPLLAMLRQQGVITELPPPTGPIADELRRYDAHMRDARGLAAGTRGDPPARRRATAADGVRGPAGAASANCSPTTFGASSPSSWKCLQQQQRHHDRAALRAYLRCRTSLRRCRAAAAGGDHITGALEPGVVAASAQARGGRAAAQFLHRHAALATARLRRSAAGAGPGAAHHRDQPAPAGRHRLAAGHRHAQAHEVTPPGHPAAAEWPPAGRWRTICVTNARPARNRARVRAPCRAARPAHRRRRHPPRGARCLPARGYPARPHPLRCATRWPAGWSASGGSIKEVADVLRHRSLNTSLIYAKLDHGALAGVALPWPGSVA